ncbi:MAG: glycosyltransferase family 4 protein [Nanoarchaeota archaeon]
MKILEICPFSAGVCGVWSRVKQESLEFSKLRYKIAIFSSNLEKATNRIVEPEEKIEDIEIFRFFTKKYPFSQNVTHFSFKKQLEIFNPDIVITHLLHPHSFQALKVCKKLNIPIFLVAHAPFNVKRSYLLDLATKFWNWRNRFRINKFDKIINITNWELPYLKNLGVNEEKIVYIPNGVPEEFFTQKKSKEENKVLFLGRISLIKNLETLISAAKNLPKIKFSIVGFAEKKYIEKIQTNLPKNIEIKKPIYNLKDKIKLIDEHKIFVLPSIREAMPQVLIEAMARGKIVISSNTDGGKEIIQNGKNGFLFEIGNAEQLTELIKKNIKINKTGKNAMNNSKKYSWKKLIKKYKELFEKCYQ